MAPATCFMALNWAADPTRDTDRPTFTAGLIALEEQITFKENLTVCNGDHIGWNIGRDVIGLRFHNRQSGHGTSAMVFVQFGRAL